MRSFYEGAEPLLVRLIYLQNQRHGRKKIIDRREIFFFRRDAAPIVVERSSIVSGADLRTKVNVIKANAHKYSVSAMCRVLQVNRSTYYYEAATKKDESELTADIQEIFRKSRNHYGTRKIKKELVDCGKQVSRRRIGRIMKQEGLISSYTTAQFKP